MQQPQRQVWHRSIPTGTLQKRGSAAEVQSRKSTAALPPPLVGKKHHQTSLLTIRVRQSPDIAGKETYLINVHTQSVTSADCAAIPCRHSRKTLCSQGGGRGWPPHAREEESVSWIPRTKPETVKSKSYARSKDKAHTTWSAAITQPVKIRLTPAHELHPGCTGKKRQGSMDAVHYRRC